MTQAFLILQAGIEARCQQNLYPYISFPALAYMMNLFMGPMGKSTRLYKKKKNVMQTEQIIC